jgi:AcrR family transcriptional regulator
MYSVRERRRRESWRALQAAAVRLTALRGFTEVTVDEIAAEAGVSRRTFFNHFPTKAAALFDPDPTDAERLARLLEEADGAPDIWAALRSICVTFVAGHEDVIAVRRRLVAESPELDQYHRTAHRHVEITLIDWVRLQQPADSFAAALIAETAAGILISSFTAWQPEDDPQLLPTLVDRGFVLLAGGLGQVLRTAPLSAAPLA